MGIDEIIGWYQKKIGTYDRQLWEKTIEQRILRGLADIRFKNAINKKSMPRTEVEEHYSELQMKSTKQKTEFIDIDLVRGSSFTKAKPKHGFVTVTRLATLRFVLLPLYSKWWVQQTGKGFILLLILYLLQLFNIAIYSYNVGRVPDDSSECIPATEIVVPIIMMWVLSFIQSQIMATQSDLQAPRRRQRCKKIKRRRKTKPQSIPKLSCDSGIHRNESSDSVRSSDKGGLSKSVIFKSDIENQDENMVSKVMITKNDPCTVDDGFESFNGNESCALKKSKRLNMKRNNFSLDSNNGFESDISEEAQEKTNSDCGRKRAKLRNWKGTKGNCGDTTSLDSEDGVTVSSPEIGENCSPLLTEVTTSATEWIGVTTNTDDCSYSSELSTSSEFEPSETENVLWDTAFAPTAILSPCCALSDKVSCTVWKRNEIKKVELSVFDISCEIIARVEEIGDSTDYFYMGMFYAAILSLLPALYKLSNAAVDSASSNEVQLSVVEISNILLEKLSGSMIAILDAALGTELWERTAMVIALIERYILACLFFFLLSVAERTFKQRFLYAKLFSHLTSSRRARKSQLPHFRLNKVRNIKTWLSVRSYLKKRGPQRSVDVIVSSTFIINLLLVLFLSMELLKDSSALQSQYNIEALFWCLGLSCLLLRFMTLATKMNRKYHSNLSILITEQINLYLQIEQKPHKKDELNVANCVLKLAADLLKELETPFKISGFSANPHLYTITKVFVLSALSGVLSEMLGFKLKLHKIKIK